MYGCPHNLSHDHSGCFVELAGHLCSALTINEWAHSHPKCLHFFSWMIPRSSGWYLVHCCSLSLWYLDAETDDRWYLDHQWISMIGKFFTVQCNGLPSCWNERGLWFWVCFIPKYFHSSNDTSNTFFFSN